MLDPGPESIMAFFTRPIAIEKSFVGPAQRAEYISKIRDLTKAIGKVWLESQN